MCCSDRCARTAWPTRVEITMHTISGLIATVDSNDKTHDTVIGIVVYQSPSPRNPLSFPYNGRAQPRGWQSRPTGKHLRGSALSDRIVIDGFHTLSYVYHLFFYRNTRSLLLYLSIPLFDLAPAAIPSKPNVRRRVSLSPAWPTPFYFHFYIQSLPIVLVP